MHDRTHKAHNARLGFFESIVREWARVQVKAKSIKMDLSKHFHTKTYKYTNTNLYGSCWHDPLFKEQDLLFLSIHRVIASSVFS